MDKLLALRTLIAVADSGGFTAAASELGKTTSSVMRIMDGLEASLGRSLLTRTTRSVTLTDIGNAYVDQVRSLLSDLARADDIVIDSGEALKGPLRVSVSATFGRLHIAPNVSRFLREHPGVTLELVVGSDSHMDLVKDRLDLALRVGVPTANENLIVKCLRPSHRFVVASPSYLNRYGYPRSVRDLTDHECIRFSYRTGQRQSWVFCYPDNTQTVDVKGQLQTNNLDMLVGAAVAGQGVALLPRWLVAPLVHKGALVRMFEGAKVTPEGGDAFVYAAYLPNRRTSRNVRAFIEFAERSIHGMSDNGSD